MSIIYRALIAFMVLPILSGCGDQEPVMIFESEFSYKLGEALEWDLELDLKINANLSEVNEEFTYKLDPTIEEVVMEYYLSSHLSNCLKVGKIPIRLEERVGTMEELDVHKYLLKLDTQITETIFEESMLISSSETFKEWSNYKIKQGWWYDETAEMLSSKVLEITPLFRDKKYNLVGEFSIPNVQETNKKNDIKDILNKEENIWVRETRSFHDLSSIRFMEEGGKDLFKRIFWDDVISGKKKVVKKNYSDEYVKFDPKELLVERIDTIFLFDPETYDELIQIKIYDPVSFENIVGYKIYQFWYFDNRTLKLHSQVVGVEPLVVDQHEDKLKSLFLIRNN